MEMLAFATECDVCSQLSAQCKVQTALNFDFALGQPHARIKISFVSKSAQPQREHPQ